MCVTQRIPPPTQLTLSGTNKNWAQFAVITESRSTNMACKINFKKALIAQYWSSDQNSDVIKEEMRHKQLENIDRKTVKTVC